MEIYGKRALSLDQLKAGAQKGMDKIELQLLNELFDKNGRVLPANEVFDLENAAKYNICAVHTPLIRGEDVCLEHVTFGEKAKMFNECCYIAEYFAQKRKRDILVIIHTEMSVKQLQSLGDNWNNIVVTVGLMLSKYPHIQIGIENVIPFRYTIHQTIETTNNFRFSNVEMAMKLRNILHTDRVGTVLDTCHVLMTQKYIKALYAALNDENMPMENLSMARFFKENSQVCKLIHLASMQGNGIAAGTHGTAFDPTNPQEMAVLKEIMDAYYKYNYTCPITLEVLEKDFLNPTSYHKELDALLPFVRKQVIRVKYA